MQEIDPNSEQESQRLDKWLKIARIFKTRSIATEACENRHVRESAHTPKPAKMIKIGDELTVKRKNGQYVKYAVKSLSQKSISARGAQLLYEKIEPKISEETKEILQLMEDANKKQKPPFKGRPTKKERRKLERFKNGFFSKKS